jgi:hypothetical protein
MSSDLPQATRCSQCSEEIPAGFEFCGKCGAKLGTAPLLSKGSRERSLLENDIAEAVADRLIKLGKTAGAFFLAAVSILALSLGIWGLELI